MSTAGQFPASTVLGNPSASLAQGKAMTSAELTGLCNPFTSSLPGDVPASGGGTTNLLRADGVWTAVLLTTNVTGILSGTNGGTGVNNGTSTITVKGSFTTNGTASLPAIVQGDVWYGSAAGVITALAKNTTSTRYLTNTGTSNGPTWDVVNLTNGVTGILPAVNGGTGVNNGTNSITLNGTLTINGNMVITPAATGYAIWSGGTLTNGTYGQYPGVTAATAAIAGNIGEYVSSEVLVGSAVVATSGVSFNVTTASLSGGEWIIDGIVWTNVSGGNNQSVGAAISLVSATLPTRPGKGAYSQWAGNVSTQIGQYTGRFKASFATTTTVYLVAVLTWDTGTNAGYGYLQATRSH